MPARETLLSPLLACTAQISTGLVPEIEIRPARIKCFCFSLPHSLTHLTSPHSAIINTNPHTLPHDIYTHNPTKPNPTHSSASSVPCLPLPSLILSLVVLCGLLFPSQLGVELCVRRPALHCCKAPCKSADREERHWTHIILAEWILLEP